MINDLEMESLPPSLQITILRTMLELNSAVANLDDYTESSIVLESVINNCFNIDWIRSTVAPKGKIEPKIGPWLLKQSIQGLQLYC
jgi:hypothetical protein